MQKCILNLAILFQAKKNNNKDKKLFFSGKQSFVKSTLLLLLESLRRIASLSTFWK